jgi:methionyl-tRNA formyltransferase
MRFAFAGIDFLSDVFEGLVESGWEPVKLFTRPCDRIYDFNDLVVASAQSRRIPIQLSRITPPDLAELAEVGCEVLAVAGYPWRIPAWDDDLAFAFNVHPSPLPIGRGPYPLFRAIRKISRLGVTAHVLALNSTPVPILAQRRLR